MKKIFVIVLILILILIVIAVPIIWYNVSVLPVNKDNTEKIEIEIPIGYSSDDIAQVLVDNHLIKKPSKYL